LTDTLGVALLTTLTYGMDTSTVMITITGIYVCGVYGGSYTNIPKTATSVATVMGGYRFAGKGFAG